MHVCSRTRLYEHFQAFYLVGLWTIAMGRTVKFWGFKWPSGRHLDFCYNGTLPIFIDIR